LEIQPGSNLGPYRILEQIGRGGMATVFKAFHPATERTVAVKVLPRQLAEEPEFTGRFRREARTIANLEHPHILPIYDYGESDGYTYLVMRYLDAGDLRRRIAGSAGRGLPLEQIDSLFSQLAEGLDYAHGRGVVHRDIKPANVLIDNRGGVFLTDFGIARLVEGTTHLTGTGTLLGTPSYMSPQQGQGTQVDRRSDIYSLGIVLYEMLTGRVPYQAETPAAVIYKHIYEPLPLPSTLRPGISPAIEQVLLKALAKSPADRFASAGAFLQAWKAALGGGTTVAAQPARSARPSNRRLLLVGGGLAALAGLLVLVVVAALVITQLLPRLRQDGGGEEVTVDDEEAVATAEVAQATMEAAPVDVVGPPASIVLGREPLPAPDYSGREWTTWGRPNAIRRLAIHDDEIIAGAVGSLTIWDRRDGSLLADFTTNEGLPGPEIFALWPDADGVLWAGAESGLGRYDPEEGAWRLFGEGDGLDAANIRALLRLADGRLLAGTIYGQPGSGLSFYDGESWQLVPGFPSAYDPDQLSPDVMALLEGPESELWVGTGNGLGQRQGEAWRRYTVEDGLPSNTIYALARDSQGRLWVGTDNGAATFDGERFQPVAETAANVIHDIFVDADGAIWLTGRVPNVARLDPASGEWTFGETEEWYGVTQDADGRLYFGSSSEGLLVQDGESLTAWLVPNAPLLRSPTTIVPAPDGSLWFGGYGGVDRLDPATGEWAPVEDFPCCPWPLTYDELGRLWLGGYSELWLIEDNEISAITPDQGLPPDANVQAVGFLSDGNLVVGTEGGLVWTDGREVSQVLTAGDDSGLPSSDVRALLVEGEDIWVGTTGGLSFLDAGQNWRHYTVGDPFGEGLQSVSDVVRAENGALWIATTGDGLYRLEDDEFTHFEGGNPAVPFGSNDVVALSAAPDGSIWVAVSYDGVYRFQDGRWTDYRWPNGLADNAVADIHVDGEGVVWVATSRGNSRLRPGQ
jgi:ligand-binding sensor domain-containing protein